LITEPKLLTQRVSEIYAQYVRDDAVSRREKIKFLSYSTKRSII